MKKIILFFTLLLSISTLQSQSNKIDSLEACLKKEKNNHAKTYNDLAEAYMSITIDKSHHYVNKALKFSKEFQNLHEESRAYLNLGRVFFHHSDFDTALVCWEKGLEITQKSGDKKNEALLLNNLGVVYKNWGDYKNALDYYHKSLKIQEEIGDTLVMAYTLNNIGNIYYFMKDNDYALQYYERGLTLYKQINSRENIAKNLNSIGLIYQKKGDKNKAHDYFAEALEIFKKINNKAGMARTYNNLGINFKIADYYTKALEYCEKSLIINIEMDNKKEIAFVKKDMGDIYYELKQYDKALTYYKESTKLAEEIHLKSELSNNFLAISKVYQIRGQYELALKYYQDFTEIKDKIYNEKFYRKMLVLEDRYETAQKQKEIERLEKQKLTTENENLRQRLFIAILLVVIIIILAIVIYVWNISQIRKKANTLLQKQKQDIEDKNAKLQKQKEEIIKQRNQIEKQRDEFKKLNATKDKFFSIVAHDLRGPFNSLMNISDLLKNNYENYNEDQIKSYIDIINSSSKDAFDLLENLLHWARAQTNRLKITSENVDIAQLVKKAIKLYQNHLTDKKITVNNQIAVENSPIVFSDVNMTDTVIRNLISNAVKFTPNEGQITIQAFKNKANYDIIIEDTGVGMNKNIRENLFKLENSISTAGTNQEKGTGLGLILCKEFVEKNAGEIFVESTVNVGSKFIIRLPAVTNKNTTDSNNQHSQDKEEEQLIDEINELLKKKNTHKTTPKVHIDPKIKEKLPIIIERVEVDFKEQLKKIKHNNSIDEIIEFGRALKKFGKENNIQNMIDYGNELVKEAGKFDIIAITQLLENYDDLVDELKNI